ncbi:MAG: ABC transporter permease [Planctomycetes bacterium]|nr:ABC transporter permease [Planctomycetota bacterium]
MTTLWQDIRYGFRQLRKDPGFTAVAVLTLALGIGANTIMFSMVNAVLLRPINAKEPARLVSCFARSKDDSYGWFRHSSYLEVCDHNPVFSDLLAYRLGMAVLRRGEVARRGMAGFVSSNYFSTLGVTPIRGRAFLPEEEQLGTEPVVILSHRAWLEQGADPDIVGQEVRINDVPFRVVGVAPEGFTGVALAGPDFWMPLGVYDLLDNPQGSKGAKLSLDQRYPWVALVGRLKPGLSMAAAQARLEPLAAQLAQDSPERWQEITFRLDRLPRANVNPGPDDRRRLLPYGLFLMAVSVVVLLIACLNLASMYFVRGVTRRREIAIRMAAGASRARIVRQLLIESLLLALLGGLLGLGFAHGGARILNASLSALVASFLDASLGLKVALDIRVLLVTLAFCGLATVLSGLRPALRLSRRPISTDLKEVRGNAAQPTRETRRLLPPGFSAALQMALSVVLVMAAGLFTHSAIKAARGTLGYSLDGKLVVEVDPRAAGYTRTQGRQVCESLVRRLGMMPGVLAAGISTSPLFGLTPDGGRVVDRSRGPDANAPADRDVGWVVAYSVGGDYFQSMDLPLLQGRYFTPAENASSAAVVVIDEPLARRLRPDGKALGCLISTGDPEVSEVVGIVPGVRTTVFDEEPQPHVYYPFQYIPDSAAFFVNIHLRAASTAPGALAALLQRVPQEVRSVDPRVPVLSLGPLAEYYYNSFPMWLARTIAGLAMTFGSMALFLATLGIYGVKSYLVASRTPEVGIRMALGATRRSILALVLREGAALTLVGLSAGMVLAIAAARVMSSALCGVNPIDPLSIGATLALLGTASLLASYLPARRAAKIDPMAALRYE